MRQMDEIQKILDAIACNFANGYFTRSGEMWETYLWVQLVRALPSASLELLMNMANQEIYARAGHVRARADAARQGFLFAGSGI